MNGVVHDWLSAALSWEPEQKTVSAGGQRVRCCVWRAAEHSTGLDDVLLVHGNAAQSEWWAAVAPLLAQNRTVVAMDLSGHGLSSDRAEYSLKSWARELADVVAELFAGRPVVAVGHSMGGLVSLQSAWDAPDLFDGLVLLDTPLRRYTAAELDKRRAIARRPRKIHPSLEAAVAAFGTVPPVPSAPQELMDLVAHRSFRPDHEGWALNCDPLLYDRVTNVDDYLRPFPARTFLLRAQRGLIDDEMAEELMGLLGHPERLVTLDSAGHNLLLEEPRGTAWAIEICLSHIKHGGHEPSE